MNALMWIDNEWLFLSLVNIQKLLLFHEENSGAYSPLYEVLSKSLSFFPDYHSSLLHILSRINATKKNENIKKDCQWLQKVIKCKPSQLVEGRQVSIL